MRERTIRGLDHRGRPHPIHHHPGDRPEARRRHEHGRHPGRPGGFHQARRGAVREAILRVLADEPMHGYQLMQAFADRTDGRWHPSAGSIYPNLQQLEDEGLVTGQVVEGRRVFSLTDAGRTAAAGLADGRPFTGRQDSGRDLRGLGRDVGMAAMQVGRMGSPAAVDAAAAILTAARRDLYRLLADDPGAETATTSPDPDLGDPDDGTIAG